eukprot:1192597-Prorocentrum_minimum.AAC.4
MVSTPITSARDALFTIRIFRCSIEQTGRQAPVNFRKTVNCAGVRAGPKRRPSGGQHRRGQHRSWGGVPQTSPAADERVQHVPGGERHFLRRAAVDAAPVQPAHAHHHQRGRRARRHRACRPLPSHGRSHAAGPGAQLGRRQLQPVLQRYQRLAVGGGRKLPRHHRRVQQHQPVRDGGAGATRRLAGEGGPPPDADTKPFLTVLCF